MNVKLGLAAFVAAASIALFGAACGGDDDDSDVPTPPGDNATSIAPDITPFATPLIEGNNVTSDSKGYAVTIPDGWRPRINYLQTTDGSVDAYFEPLIPGATVQASITVQCITEKAENPEEYANDYKTRTARVGLNENIEEVTATIDGQEVPAVRYIATSQANPNQPRLAKTDYLLTGDICDYTITTTSAEADREKYQPAFDGFLSSFRLLD